MIEYDIETSKKASGGLNNRRNKETGNIKELGSYKESGQKDNRIQRRNN